MVFYLRLKLLAVLALLIFAASAFAAPAVYFTSIEAARSDWNSDSPPESGWVTVSLPDDWSKRWPNLDGVVWYRLTFNTDQMTQPIAAMIDYWTLAGAIWLNGSLLDRDPSLVEPLSRSWNVSRFFRLSPPTLQNGENTVLVRVSGLSAYQPGLGTVTIGDADIVKAAFDQTQFLRRDIALFDLSFTLALAFFFLIVWLMRRIEAAYGWYALMSLAWAVYSINQIARSPWPLPSTDAWSRAAMILFIISCMAFFMFAIRFCGRSFPRLERMVLWGSCLASLWMAITPQIQETRIVLSVASVSLYIATCLLFLALTYKVRRIDIVALNVVNIIILLGAVYDVLLFTGLLPGTIYTFPITTQFRVVSMAFMLAWHFVASLTRIERFNQELVEKIRLANQELARTLREQHELAIANTRQTERMSLLHNLHDGLGGTLVNNIALLEHKPEKLGTERFLSILKELREELRIVVDTSTGQINEHQSLPEWLAPLRSRYVLLCESRNIACDWHLEGLESCRLPSRQGLDLMRILQESITNALKHANPSNIRIAMRAEETSLLVRVEDDGRGFDVVNASSGTGLQSLRTRVQRLNGRLEISSRPGATILTACIPLPG